MNETSKPHTVTGDKARADREARLMREAAALRANLRRRKQQVRARAVKAPQDEGPDDDVP